MRGIKECEREKAAVFMAHHPAKWVRVMGREEGVIDEPSSGVEKEYKR